MKNTYQFITHVVNNLFPINEYSDAEINRLMEKFKEEADDFNITISDEQLKKYIERFDQLKNSPKVQEKDLRKWSLSNLIKLITSSEGAEVETEKRDQTPDVIYDEDGYIIWNGSKEGNCITYGAGEKWCITRGSFGNYRYSKDRGYPTFYLVKNENLPQTDKLSFVAIQVRDVDEENKRYVYTNRQNSPYESNPMSFSGLTSEVPWLNDIPNIKSLLKYIPLSSQEKSTQLYKNEAISIREWVDMPFSEKKQYLVVRSTSNSLFSDITNSEFVANYLPKYPQIATFIAVTPNLINSTILLKNLDKFSNNDRKSITANLRDLVDLGELKRDTLSFDVKKLLTILNKWNIANNERIYVTKNGEAIVKLTFEGGEVKVGVFTAENDYPNIKLNKRTSKFLLDYPELDKIPFNSLLKLAKDEVIDKDIINKVLQSAETDPDSAIVVKDTEDGKIILDSNTFTSYKVEGDKIVQIPFDNEEVQNVLSSEEDNAGFQESAVNLVFGNKQDIPPQIEKDSFLNILKSTPYDKRTKNGIVAIPFSDGIVGFPTDVSTRFNNSMFRYGIGSNPWNKYTNYMGNVTVDMYKAYFNYLKSKNIKYTDEQIAFLLQGVDKNEFIAALPPMVDNSMYKPATDGETSYLVNTRNPRESKAISRLNKLIKANLSPAQAQRLLGTTTQAPATAGAQTPTAQAPTAQPPAGAPRRGRPAGVAGVARPAAAPVAGGTPTSELMDARGLATAWNALPTSVRNRLASSVQENGISRGASRRNNQLGGRGRVVSTWNSGPSSIYFIRLNNGTTIASINIQPGNGNYILIPGREPIRLNSPTELLSALQARDLAEVLIAEFMVSNPTKLTETKKILNYYIKSKNRKK